MIEPVALLVFPDRTFADDLEGLLEDAGVLPVRADTDQDAARLVREFTPDLLLLDLSRPMREVIRLLGELTLGDEAPAIVWFGEQPTPDSIERVQRAGAKGYIDKRTDPGLIAYALRTVLRGETFFPGFNTCPATPGAKGIAQSERLLKVLKKLPAEAPVDPC